LTATNFLKSKRTSATKHTKHIQTKEQQTQALHFANTLYFLLPFFSAVRVAISSVDRGLTGNFHVGWFVSKTAGQSAEQATTSWFPRRRNKFSGFFTCCLAKWDNKKCAGPTKNSSILGFNVLMLIEMVWKEAQVYSGILYPSFLSFSCLVPLNQIDANSKTAATESRARRLVGKQEGNALDGVFTPD